MPRTAGEVELADRARRYIGKSAALRPLGSDGVGVRGIVGERDAGLCKPRQQFAPGRCVAGLPGGDQEVDWTPLSVDQSVDLGGQPAPGASHATIVNAPFLMAAPCW